MPDTKPKNLREAIAFANTFPRGRRITGYVATTWLCDAENSPRFVRACEGAKRFAEEIKPHLTADQIAAIDKKFGEEVSRPYGFAFPIEQLRLRPELFSRLSIVRINLDEWANYMRLMPTTTASTSNEFTDILFGVGQLVVWPFLLSYALALRLTKVTIDVFEWAK